jgi:hypothetical protein
MYTRIAGAVVLTALFGFMTLPARAAGLQNIGTYHSGNVTLLVDTYTDTTGTVGLIAIKADGRSLSYSFEKADLPALYALWNKAQNTAQGSDATKFVAAGSVAEPDTHALDVLLLAAGPSVRFSVADPVDGILVFDLALSDRVSFDTAIHQVGNALTL